MFQTHLVLAWAIEADYLAFEISGGPRQLAASAACDVDRPKHFQSTSVSLLKCPRANLAAALSTLTNVQLTEGSLSVLQTQQAGTIG